MSILPPSREVRLGQPICPRRRQLDLTQKEVARPYRQGRSIPAEFIRRLAKSTSVASTSARWNAKLNCLKRSKAATLSPGDRASRLRADVEDKMRASPPSSDPPRGFPVVTYRREPLPRRSALDFRTPFQFTRTYTPRSRFSTDPEFIQRVIAVNSSDERLSFRPRILRKSALLNSCGSFSRTSLQSILPFATRTGRAVTLLLRKPAKRLSFSSSASSPLSSRFFELI